MSIKKHTWFAHFFFCGSALWAFHLISTWDYFFPFAVSFLLLRLDQTGWKAMLRQAVHFQYCRFSKLNLKIRKLSTCNILLFFLFCFSSKPCITSSVLFTFKSLFRVLLMLYDRANCFSAFWFSVKWWIWLPFDPLSQPKQPKPNQLFTHSWLHSGIIFQIISVQSDKKD